MMPLPLPPLLYAPTGGEMNLVSRRERRIVLIAASGGTLYQSNHPRGVMKIRLTPRV
jgi:hypothetical protein